MTASAAAPDAAGTSNSEGHGDSTQGGVAASRAGLSTDSSAHSAGSLPHDAMALHRGSRYDAAYHQVGIMQQFSYDRSVDCMDHISPFTLVGLLSLQPWGIVWNICLPPADLLPGADAQDQPQALALGAQAPVRYIPYEH